MSSTSLESSCTVIVPKISVPFGNHTRDLNTIANFIIHKNTKVAELTPLLTHCLDPSQSLNVEYISKVRLGFADSLELGICQDESEVARFLLRNKFLYKPLNHPQIFYLEITSYIHQEKSTLGYTTSDISPTRKTTRLHIYTRLADRHKIFIQFMTSSTSQKNHSHAF